MTNHNFIEKAALLQNIKSLRQIKETDTNYSRTDLTWYFINHEKVKGKFNWSIHIPDWETVDQQQQLSIIYIFGK